MEAGGDGWERLEVRSTLTATVVSVSVGAGDPVSAGDRVVVVESMKMEHPVLVRAAGTVAEVAVEPGATVGPGDLLLTVRVATDPGPPVATEAGPPAATDPGPPAATEAGPPAAESGAGATDQATAGWELRPELAEVLGRRADRLDTARPEAVERRHRLGRRTARENVAALCDPGSFEEYGGLALAAQRRRRSFEELVAKTPADGLVAGVGQVNGDRFPPERSRCAVLSYDATVLAGTQGQTNHRKKDRLFDVVRRLRLPVVLFAEGGGGRPGDTDTASITGLDTMAFALFARLSGLVPLVGIASGRCFAGNAALLGCCDVIIATADATIGMGGPAMIEGGGLGVFSPEEVGPLGVQVRNGVVDVAADDDAAAVEVARRYLAFFQGATDPGPCADQRLLREVVPPDRRRVYDVHDALVLLADLGSVLELRPKFAPGMVTALARLEGVPVGVVANNPVHLSGAIDSAGADKAARFLQLCEAHGLPVVFLCDTPGFMVGPDSEREGAVRHTSRMFLAGASLTVPFVTVVLRKGYGLGAQAMAGGSFHASLLTVSWPTGEFGGMGLEGAVRLGFRRELEAVADPAERQALFDDMVARAYEHGKALNVASSFEIDDVIDPADTRRRILAVLRAVGGAPAGEHRRRFVDAW